MRPLTAAEAADLAAVITHPVFSQIERLADGRWYVEFHYPDTDGEVRQALSRRTLRAAIRAAVRWIEEQDHAR